MLKVKLSDKILNENILTRIVEEGKLTIMMRMRIIFGLGLIF